MKPALNLIFIRLLLFVTLMISDKKPQAQKPSLDSIISKLNNKTSIKSKSRKFTNQAEITQTKTDSTHLWKYGTGKTPDRVFISSWNINGIRGVMRNDRNGLMPYIKKFKPDILCMMETKIDQDIWKKQPIIFDGYNGYWNFCKCSSGYSGVAVLSKFQPISMTQDLQDKQLSQEGRLITLEFQKFYLVCVYVPTSGQQLERLTYRVQKYQPAFHRHCENLRKAGKPVIICGDLNVAHENIDLHRGKDQKTGKLKDYSHMPAVTPLERGSFTSFLNKGWVDTYRHFNPDKIKYTWWNRRISGRGRNIGWRLDYILVNRQALPCVWKVQINNQAEGSDHCPVEVVMDLSLAFSEGNIPKTLEQIKQQKRQRQLQLHQSLQKQMQKLEQDNQRKKRKRQRWLKKRNKKKEKQNGQSIIKDLLSGSQHVQSSEECEKSKQQVYELKQKQNEQLNEQQQAKTQYEFSEDQPLEKLQTIPIQQGKKQNQEQL